MWRGFPGDSAGKESACNAGDLGSIPGLGRSPGEGKGYPLQYSGLENSRDCIVSEVTKSQTRLSDFHFPPSWPSLLPISPSPLDHHTWSGRFSGEGIGYQLQYSWVSLVAQLVKKSSCNAGDPSSIPEWGRSPGEGIGFPLQYSGLENPRTLSSMGS